ncbi:MAG TPA: DUF4215 domain-containing protein [Kofleriaceae bacterium]|nr:DUF4215 domain-containing protein [Kofleriaceae bacterium]
MPFALLGAALFIGCGDNSSAKSGDDDSGEDCATPGDEDGNGLADCADPACVATPQCRTPEGLCGNGVLDKGEVCDDGNTVDGDGCDSNCTVTACGNGIVTDGEKCDDGNTTDGDGCDSNCTVTACGNGIITGSETCDDGNTTDGDGCDSTCVPSGCGNGVVSTGEQCDDGNHTDGDGCDSNCTRTACGNGIMTAGEACDDGNTINWDGCSATCNPNVFTYVKASNTDAGDTAGGAVVLSADGSTMAVGAEQEASKATGVGGNAADNSAKGAGAVYIYARSGNTWIQQAYVKASNTDANDHFGFALALSADGSTLAVGAFGEDSASATDQTDNSAMDAGAAYVFTRSGTTWTQQAYIKASNRNAGDSFGKAVALSGDGATLAVGAISEDSSATGVNGNQADGTALDSGAAYVFTRTGTAWTQQAYVKASNTGAGDNFGASVGLSTDGATLAVGAINEAGNGTSQADDSDASAGAAYVFALNGTWTQQAYVKASDPAAGAAFGTSLSLSGDGATLAVGAEDVSEGMMATEGEVYVYALSAGTWSQSAGVKASNPQLHGFFGHSVALSADGSRLAVGAYGESSKATGVGGNQADMSALFAGAAYVFAHSGASWTQQSYVKALNTDASDFFGYSVSLSTDGSMLAVGAPFESSKATGINGSQTDNSAGSSGATYIYQ